MPTFPLPRVSILALAAAAALVGGSLTGSAVARQSAGNLRQQFVGHWRLVSFVNFDDNGATRDAGYESGRIMYDTHGNMSAQLMRWNRKRLSQPSTEAERAAAYAGYVGYYGRYTIDPAAKTVTHHVEGSANPNWVKTDLVRYFELAPDGTRLMLSVRNAQGRTTGTLTWQRIE